MLGLCNSGLYGTDQYSLYSLCGEATTAIVRHVMIGINRPEILKTRGWLVTPHAHALVGYRGFSLGGELSFRFHGSAIWLSGKGFLPAGQAEIILDGRPQLLSNRNKADDVLWHSGNLAVGEHTLRLKSLRGLLSLDGIGIAMQ